MPTAYTTMLLSDGTLGANLVDNTNYNLLDSGWSPAVASRRLSRMAGVSPYAEVVEEINLVVRGSTAAVAFANLAKLSHLMDLATRFWNGDDVDPVTLAVQPQGSVLADPVKALVLGRPPNADSFMSLPVTYNDYLHLFEIEPVTLRFLRSGLWYGALDSPSAAGTAANPSIQTVTFGDSLYLSAPTTLSITGFASDSTDLTESYLFVASDGFGASSSIQLIEGESGSPDAGGVTLTSTADAGANARGGSVGRVTSPSTTAYEGISFLLTAPVTAKRGYIIGAFRNNTAATWYVYGASHGSSGKEGTPTKIIKIDGTKSTAPQIIPLGICYNSENHASIRIYVKCSTAGGSEQLDIDYLAILGMDNENNHVLHIIPGSDVNTIDNFTIDPRPLTDISPSVVAEDNTVLPADYPLGYDGDVWLATNSDEASVVWFATRGSYWRWSDSTNTVLSNNLTMTRRVGYLTPQ